MRLLTGGIKIKEMAIAQGETKLILGGGIGKAGFGSGDFYAEPTPHVKLRPTSRVLHLGKVAFEKF